MLLLVLFLTRYGASESRGWEIEGFVGPISFHLTGVVTDALFKLYFIIVLFICILRYMKAMKYMGMAEF